MTDQASSASQSSGDNAGSDVETKARSMGWTGKDEFRGSPDNWIDAETFVRRGEEVLPIVKANLKNTQTELQKAREQLEAQGKSIEDFKSFMEAARERDRQEFSQQIKALKSAKSEAIKEGDGDRVLQIEEAIEGIQDKQKEQEKKPEPEKTQVKQPDPVFVEWVGENAWYGTNSAMTRIADGIAADLKEENPSLGGKAFLNMVKERFKQRFPEKFGESRAQVDIGEGDTKPKGKRGYDNLPSDAKKQCDEFVKLKILTRDQYVADYQW